MACALGVSGLSAPSSLACRNLSSITTFASEGKKKLAFETELSVPKTSEGSIPPRQRDID